MNKLAHKTLNRKIRSHRVRAKVTGSTQRPRMAVRISNLHVSAQIIDDSKQTTLVSITTVGQKDVKGTMTEKAAWAGTQIAKKAVTAKVKKVVLDRGSKLYHGRVKSFADSARKAGLEL